MFSMLLTRERILTCHSPLLFTLSKLVRFNVNIFDSLHCKISIKKVGAN